MNNKNQQLVKENTGLKKGVKIAIIFLSCLMQLDF